MKYKFKKKAVLFSLISVLFAVLFVTLYSQNLNTVYEDRLPGTNIRIKVMDTYTRNFEKYLSDSIKVSTYQTLDAITIYRYNKNPRFFSNSGEFNNTFSSCMICGYTNCSDIIPANDCNTSIYSLTKRLDSIKTIALDQLNIKTTYNINSIEIEQKVNFEVEVKVNISYNITDKSASVEYAEWNKEILITQPVTIIGLLDPKGYLNDSTNTYKRNIKRYQGNCEYNESCWNINTVEEFYTEKSFRQYQGGGSFLSRYWNDMTPSNCCGIETILHPSELSLIDKNNSYVDSYYWDGTNKCNTKIIINVSLNSEDIHFDNYTAARYLIPGTQYCKS